MGEDRSKSLALYLVLALGSCCFFIFHDPALAQPSLVPLAPRTTTARAPIVGVTLRWDKGVPAETTVSNLSTRTFIYAGLADAVMFAGLPIGSTNRFIAYNDVGTTQVVDAVATNQNLTCKIKVHTYMVTVPTRPSEFTAILTSTNLLTWYQINLISTTNASYSFVWTNDGAAARYFRTTSP